jgi:glutamate racemase
MTRLGIYDSGVGGISILKEIRKTHPDLAITYLADEEIMPLGEKTREYIRNRLKKACRYLFDNGCSLVLLACNTASVVSIRYLQETWIRKEHETNHNILGINKPLMEAMSERYANLKDKKGVLISTSATYDSGYYQNDLEERGYYDVQAVSSSDLASAIEAGDTERIDADIMRVLGKVTIVPEEVDFVILACTHYPFALTQIRRFFRSDTEFIEPGPAVAYKLGDYLWRHPEYKLENGQVKYLTTGGGAEFAERVHKLADETINAEHVDI